MTRTVPFHDPVLNGNRVASTQTIRWTVSEQRLRRIVPAVHLAEPEPRPSPTASSLGRHWLGRAWRALSTGDFLQAAYAAGMARQYGETLQTPLVLARADAGMENFDRAVVEAQRAVQMDPDDAERRLTLGGIFEELGNWTAAEQCYRDAARLAPGSDAPEVGRASVLMRMGKVEEAVRILERLRARGSEESLVGEYLALALVQAAEQVPRIRDTDSYVITAPVEIARMRERLARAAAVTRSPDTRAGIAAIRSYVDRCARREWAVAQAVRRLRPRASAGSVGTAGIVALAVTLTLARMVSPLAAVAAVLVAAGCVLLGYGFVPRWRLNKWVSEAERADSSTRPYRP